METKELFMGKQWNLYFNGNLLKRFLVLYRRLAKKWKVRTEIVVMNA